ncbi:MAG: efflux RND transporter permease subunit [Calditrichia bacterium]
MGLIKLIFHNRQFVFTFFVFFLVVGIVSLFTIPRYENPPMTAPGISIFVGYPGGSPGDLETLILDPLEEAFHEISDIKKIHSICKDNLIELRIEFDHGTDIDDKYREVVDQYNSIEHMLPEEIAWKLFVKWAVSDINIYQFALIPNHVNWDRLKDVTEELRKDLEKIKEVKKISVSGLPEKRIFIDIDPNLLAEYNLSFPDIAGIIQHSNIALPSGNFYVGEKNIQIKLNSEIVTIDQLKNLIIKSNGLHVLRLKDVARIYGGHDPVNAIIRCDQSPALFISVSQKEGVNIYNVSQEVMKTVSTFKRKYHHELSVITVFDQSRIVSHRLNNFAVNFGEGLILVAVIVVLLINVQASLIILISLPLSLLIAIFALDLQGIGLEQVSIAGMIIALGMLVDNAIVVTENIERHLREGKSKMRAILEAPAEVLWPVFTATATTILAFAPMLFLDSMVGDFIKSLPLVVIYSLAASYMIALTLNPLLSYYYLPEQTKERFSFLRKGLEKFLTKVYQPILKELIHRPMKYIWIPLILFLFSLALLPFIGISFFPKAEIPYIIIQVSTPKGTNLNATDAVVKKIEEKLVDIPHIRHISTSVGQGNPRIYYNHFTPLEDPSISEILVELNTFSPIKIGEIVDTVRSRLSNVTEADINVIEFMQGPPQEAPIEIRIIGQQLDRIDDVTAQIKKILSKHPAVVNIQTPTSMNKMELKIKIDRDKAAMLGIGMTTLAQTMRAAIEGFEVKHLKRNDGEKFPIVVRIGPKDSIRYSSIKQIKIPSVSGALVPLNEIAEFFYETTPVEIRHYNFDRIGLIKADVKRDYSAVKVIGELERQIKEAGIGGSQIQIQFGGEKESQQEAFGSLYYAFMIAFLMVLLILVIQFKSYFQPLIIVSAVPLSTVGSFVLLFITGNSFSFMAFIGFISLVGIVVNNSIVLVDYTNQLLARGKPLDEVIIDAASTRFRPILSTTITTILGIFPLTIFGGTLWAPLGWVVIGGLVSSTLLTLLVVPALYKLLYKVERSFNRSHAD